jgi:hypothetical protein
VQSAYSVRSLRELYETIQTDVHSESSNSTLCRPIEGGRHIDNETESSTHFNERAAHNKQNTDTPFVERLG